MRYAKIPIPLRCDQAAIFCLSFTDLYTYYCSFPSIFKNVDYHGNSILPQLPSDDTSIDVYNNSSIAECGECSVLTSMGGTAEIIESHVGNVLNAWSSRKASTRVALSNYGMSDVDCNEIDEILENLKLMYSVA
jgi:hypothetical protein